MDQPYDTTQLDPTTLQNLLGNSNTSLIPESLVTTLIVSFVILNVLGVLFFVFYVLGIIRKWKVQSAVLNMQKDLSDIKAQLVQRPVETGAPPVASPSPSRVIAKQDTDTSAQA